MSNAVGLAVILDFHMCVFIVDNILSPQHYHKRCHRSCGTIVNAIPIPAITVVSVIKFNPITAVTAVVPSSPSPCSSLIRCQKETLLCLGNQLTEKLHVMEIDSCA